MFLITIRSHEPLVTLIMRQLISRIKDKTEFLQFTAVVNQGGISLIGLLRTLIVVRLLSPEDYGVIGITLAVGSAFSIFQNLGLGVGVAKEAAQTSDPRMLRLVSLVVLGVRFTMLLPLLALLILIGSPQAVATYQIPQLQQYILFYAVFLFVSSPGDILGYILTGTSRFRSYFLLKFFNEIILTVAVCLSIWKWQVAGYFVGQAVAGGIYTLISAYAVLKTIGGPIERVSLSEFKLILRSVFKTSLSVFISKLARGFSLQIPVLIAAIYIPVSAVGLLKFGMQAGGYFATFLSAVQIVTLPRMTNILKDHGQEYLFIKFSENYRRLASAMVCMMICAVMLAPELVYLVGGERFAQSYHSFQLIIIFYTLVMLADNIFSGIHFPLNREGSYVCSYLIYFCVAVICSCLFLTWLKTPESGLYGVCLGAIIHFGIAIFQTKEYKLFFKSIVKIAVPVLFVLIMTIVCANSDLNFERFWFGFFTIFLIVLYTLKNDPKIFRK